MMNPFPIPAAILVFTIFVSSSFIGCMPSNKPNSPLSGPVSEISFIEDKNPLLATELKKLPEIKDGLSKGERQALQLLSELYRIQTSKFEAAFAEMYAVGIPEHRKYCSPLQAIFWIAKTAPHAKDENPINPYDLTDLLNEAWTFPYLISSQLLDDIVDSINDPEVREDFQKNQTASRKYRFYKLLSLAKYSPGAFEEWALAKMEEMKEDNSWTEYEVVLDRLNSPELVDFYVKKQIGYENYWEIGSYDHRKGNAYYVFKNKRGDCLYISEFIARALRKNGYHAWVEKKPPLRSVDSWHAVCVFEYQGEKYIIDDGRKRKRGILSYADY